MRATEGGDQFRVVPAAHAPTLQGEPARTSFNPVHTR
jgi:hypothetical protein